MMSTTIVAPATPHGIGGIAVVRLSGPQSSGILSKLINNNALDINKINRIASLSNISDVDGKHIDEVVATFFKSPNSYTGEDVVELSCHGNPLIVEQVVTACVDFGAELADPGEFTRRAFVNGKMDLLQAEAVASLIHAKSEESGSLNLKILSGDLSKKINDIQDLLINAASLVEFELDISEEELQPNIIKDISNISADVSNKISELLKSYKQARLMNRGALVVIAGEPNVGKSTLLNALTESDRAITSTIPGTTRDAIDVPLLLDGVPINLIDTAGIRPTNEEVESEGVRRSQDYIEKADLILFVHDATLTKSQKISTPEDVPVIMIENKSDLISNIKKSSSPIKAADTLYISAKTGDGLDVLKIRVKDVLGINPAISDTLSITTSRQQGALLACQKRIAKVGSLLREHPVSYELISIELREALDNIASILGKTTPDNILNNIFNQFCVGK